jgi:hypothetical protein
MEALQKQRAEVVQSWPTGAADAAMNILLRESLVRWSPGSPGGATRWAIVANGDEARVAPKNRIDGAAEIDVDKATMDANAI